MLTKLSSKGQLIIPKSVRHALYLEPGAQFEIEVLDKKIVLKPVSTISSFLLLDRYFSFFVLLFGHDTARSPGSPVQTAPALTGV